MSQVRSDIDLAGLARSPEIEPPKRGLGRRLLPLVLLAAFLAVLGSTLGDLLRPALEVRVVRPRVERGVGGADRAAADQVLVQAAGWVEPDPFPLHVPVLTSGVVREVLVQESDRVAAGDPVATLIDDDARLTHAQAEASLALARAARAEAEARATIAVERFDAALDVTEGLQVARADHDGKVAEAEHRDAAVEQGEARLEIAEEELVVQRELDAAGASGPRQVELAEAAVREARGLLAQLRADAALARAEAERTAAVLARRERDVELRFVDRLERDLALAARDRAAAEVERAEAVLAEAALALERTVVRSPVDGVVLERSAVPGMVLDVKNQGHAVCVLYDPTSLRVRVDVPQADVGQLFVGQAAEVSVNSRPNAPYRGEVLRIVQLADIQKVTLEAQVRVLDGDELLRPDMLAQVRFLGGGRADPAGEGGDAPADGGASTLWIPEALVQGGAVWVLDPVAGVVERRAVVLGPRRAGEVQVLGGLDATAKLVDPEGRLLESGQRVRAREERR